MAVAVLTRIAVARLVCWFCPCGRGKQIEQQHAIVPANPLSNGNRIGERRRVILSYFKMHCRAVEYGNHHPVRLKPEFSPGDGCRVNEPLMLARVTVKAPTDGAGNGFGDG